MVDRGGELMVDYVIWRCKECGYEFAVNPDLDEPNFCPYCGHPFSPPVVKEVSK